MCCFSPSKGGPTRKFFEADFLSPLPPGTGILVLLSSAGGVTVGRGVFWTHFGLL